MNRVVKSIVYGVGIVGFGYMTMKLTTPSPERVVNSLPPDLRASYEMNKKDRSQAEGVLRMIEDAKRNPKNLV
ncbi:Assembly factor cbp4 [Schizosaccharomyces pombe]|uniref:Assembly factor cbp4 n=1 Tax=Schizosaccharomyces pombe (strain 972 / ATCC 24843) TaxID=284812 RepID=CBP4_SCHPO|nr:uncharacterized protein SPBC27B12.14 [Schizosaccharomyces pombe]Q9USV6.1 RecName: Full=Assembly factor cbp4; AltName: Full=Cytochrome b mRNA-processing protein 4 [Schizosaccharomyces pombe 972h-]CAB61843.1 mitochondrial membrane protein complex assembly protein (predicted) [Schizosaccharomyces pombe]|eukprot:NP_595544.1 uncharacterized protein SPBC27B12.14 [Schizosaccharomyces pombe]